MKRYLYHLIAAVAICSQADAVEFGRVHLDVNSQDVLALPEISAVAPAAGKRVAVTPTVYAGTGVLHTRNLSRAWKKGGDKLPTSQNSKRHDSEQYIRSVLPGVGHFTFGDFNTSEILGEFPNGFETAGHSDRWALKPSEYRSRMWAWMNRAAESGHGQQSSPVTSTRDTATIDESASAVERPNVLFIVVDDLNDWIGCLKGHPQALTPNIDRLAARGVLFANAHCTSPACNPSRAAVFSGRIPHVTGVWENQAGQTLDRLYPEGRLLPTAFSQAGYLTFGTGKLLHSGGQASFDEYFSVGQRWSPLPKMAVEYTKEELPSKGTNKPRHVVKDSRARKLVLPLNRMPSDRKPNRKDGESFDWGPFDVPDSDFGDTQITDWAIKKIKQPHNKPFFLGVGYYRPHIPLWAPKRFFERFADAPGKLPQISQDDLEDISETARKWALQPVTAGSHATVVKHKQWRAAVEAYLACVTYVDHEIGRLLDSLDNSPFGDNTVIVLWSDHGWHLGEKQHWGKWTGWERSTKVPLIIVPRKKLASQFATGSRCEQPVGLIDIYPTLAELCGAKGPEKLDGESLVPLLRDPKINTGRGVVTMFNPGNGSLRTDRWRYIRYADGSDELYDLKSDPNEWDNLASTRNHARLKTSLQQKLAPFVETPDSR